MQYHFGDLELDTDRELLLGPQGPLALRRQTYRLLLLLIERAPAVVTRDELMDELWGHHALSPNVIPQTISELRQALGDDPQQPRYVETRHRRGYAFIAAVRRADARAETAAATPSTAVTASGPMDDPAGGLPAPPPDQPATAGISRQRPSRRTASVLVVFALLAALAAIVWNSMRTPPSATVAPQPLAATRLVIALDVADPALSAYLQLLARASSDWVAQRWRAPATDAQTGAHWQLTTGTDQRWQLFDPTGTERSSGALLQSDVPNQAAALLQTLEAATGHAGLTRDPLGWPGELAARAELVRAALATQQQRHAEALIAFAAAAQDGGGWAQHFHAEALARAGRWRDALTTLEGVRPGGDRALDLQVEALRARLRGRPAEALAALRAYALLVPENIDAQLAVLDAQLDESQWPAAADSLQALSARLGETSPALAWRRARWQAAMQPAQAARGHAQAVERAIAAKDTDSLRRARLAQAEWLLHSSQLGDAEAVLSALDGDDPEAQLLRAQWALERGELATARSEYIAAQLGFESRGLQGESRRSRLGLVEAALRGGDPAAAIVQAEALIEESEAQGDTRLQVDVLDALGRARTGLGQFEAAAEDFQGAIALARDQGDAHRQAKLRYHLGNAYAQERKRPQEAEQSYRLAAEAFHALRDPIWEIKALANLALMAERGGRRLDARAAYRDALARVRELGNPRERGRISFNAGVNARELGQLQAAAAHFEEAMVALGQAGATDVQVVTAAARADLACLQGDAATARRVLDATAELRTRSAPLPQSAWLTADARWQELAGEAALASARLHEAEALREQAGIRAAQLDLELRQLRLGLLDAAAARAARLPLERIEAELQRLGEPKYALVASLAAVEAALAEGDRERARALADALRAPVDARGNRAQRLQLDWLLALAGETDLRDGRLAQLNADARADGFLLLAQLAERERLAPGSDERKARDAQLLEQGLAGATRSAAAAF